jgi:hypothetical protein
MNSDLNRKSRNWCFTINNYTEEELDFLHATENLVPHYLRYMMFGKEVGKEGTPHLQGFFCMKNAIRFNSAKQVVGNRAHLEIMNGTIEHNVTYCGKDKDVTEIGERPVTPRQKGAMEKRRYAEAWDAAINGNIEDVDADIRVRHYNTLKRIRLDRIAERDLTDTEDKMLWYYGESGTGKSRKARTDHPDAYLKMCNKWWDSYVDQQVVLLEDFDIKHAVLVHHLKIWADRYPFLAEVKGGSVKIRPRLIIVTSNYHPRDIWTDPRDLEPILRRFTLVHFDKL